MQTVFVMAEDLDDTAVGHFALSALIYHSRNFSFERIEPFDATPNLGEMALCNCIDHVARAVWSVGQRQQLANISDLEAELARMTNEA